MSDTEVPKEKRCHTCKETKLLKYFYLQKAATKKEQRKTDCFFW